MLQLFQPKFDPSNLISSSIRFNHQTKHTLIHKKKKSNLTSYQVLNLNLVRFFMPMYINI